ncbi:MAG TPA: hypothetical protein VHO67_22325, partial [Polyangia bacterium]|nr:hypothetical protein [Polyangia bacterium]
GGAGTAGSAGASGGHGGASSGGSSAGGASAGGAAGATAGGAGAGGVTISGPGAIGVGCSQQPVPASVLAGDYGCDDFDTGNLPQGKSTDQGWNTQVSTSGAFLMVFDGLAASASESLLTSSSSGGTARVSWTPSSASSAPISHVVLAADVRPATLQSGVRILRVDTGMGSVQVFLTSTSSGSVLGLSLTYKGNPVGNDHPVTGTLPGNTWTRIQLDVDIAAQLVRITIPGQANAPVSGTFDPDSTAQVLVGPSPFSTQATFSGYFDDLVAYVVR